MGRSVVHGINALRWRAISRIETDLHDLRYLFWECTRRCNLECRHCGSDCSSDSNVVDPPPQTILKVLEDIALKKDPADIMLVVTGGEPLVRRDLTDTLARAHAMGFRISLVTNGWSLDAVRALGLAKAGLESVVVSLDGPKERHDWLRNRAGSFERSINALRSLRNAGVPIVEAVTCVTPITLPLLRDTLDIVKMAGATHWRVFNIFPAGRAKGNKELLLDEAGIRSLVQTLRSLRKTGREMGVTVNLSEEGWLGWDFEFDVRDSPYFCRAGINIAGIMADGSITACPNLPPAFIQGNVAVNDFLDLWENGYLIFRDRSWMKRHDCAQCTQWSICKGNSLHLWEYDRAKPAWCHYKILHS